MGSLSERTRLSNALNDIDAQIHSKLSTDEIMRSALDGFVAAIGADLGDIKVRESGEWVVRYVHGFDCSEVGTRLSVAEAPVAERVALVQELVTVTDYAQEPDSFYVGFPRAHGLRASLAVPLIVREEVIGCLFAWMRDEPRVFTAGEVDFARRMASSLALALENARLYEAEQETRGELVSALTRLEDELGTTKVLLEAAERLTSSRDPDEVLRQLSKVILDATGIGRIFINLVDTRLRLLTPKVATGGLKGLGGDQIEFERLSETGRRAIENAQTTVLDYDEPDLRESDRRIAAANNSRLVLFVPLISHGELVGHISLDEPGGRYEFSPRQVRIVEAIAAQGAAALENARLFERERRIAEVLQEALLAPPEDIDGLDVAYLYQPASVAASVGGDFYDVLLLGDGHVALSIGDVAGKGIEAAKLTALMRDGIHAYLLEEDDPGQILGRLNSLAFRFTPIEKFATVFLGMLDCSSGRLRYSSAGHPAPIVLGRDGARMLNTGSGLVGAFAQSTFKTADAALAPGEVLVMFTDGVTEARLGRELYGTDRLALALGRLCDTPLAGLPRALLNDVLAFSQGVLQDDVVIVCVSRRAGADL